MADCHNSFNYLCGYDLPFGLVIPAVCFVERSNMKTLVMLIVLAVAMGGCKKNPEPKKFTQGMTLKPGESAVIRMPIDLREVPTTNDTTTDANAITKWAQDNAPEGLPPNYSIEKIGSCYLWRWKSDIQEIGRRCSSCGVLEKTYEEARQSAWFWWKYWKDKEPNAIIEKPTEAKVPMYLQNKDTMIAAGENVMEMIWYSHSIPPAPEDELVIKKVLAYGIDISSLCITPNSQAEKDGFTFKNGVLMPPQNPNALIEKDKCSTLP